MKKEIEKTKKRIKLIKFFISVVWVSEDKTLKQSYNLLDKYEEKLSELILAGNKNGSM
jgi:uncharacterized protein YktB (UPF0637 family)